MTFMESVQTCVKQKYAVFSGRASRSEYWWFLVFIFIVNVVAVCIDLSASNIYEKSELFLRLRV